MLLMTQARRYVSIFLRINLIYWVPSKAMVENEINLKVKSLQSHNGGEYVDDDFEKILYW